MMKFKKTIRVVSLFIAAIFLFTNTAYGIDLSERTHLRKHLLGNSEEGQMRVKQALDGFTSSDLSWFREGSIFLGTIAFVNIFFLKPYCSPYNWLIHGHLNDLLMVPGGVYFLTWFSMIGVFGRDFSKKETTPLALRYGKSLLFTSLIMESLSGIFKSTDLFAVIGGRFDVYDLLSFVAGYGILWLSMRVKGYFQRLREEDPSGSSTRNTGKAVRFIPAGARFLSQSI